MHYEKRLESLGSRAGMPENTQQGKFKFWLKDQVKTDLSMFETSSQGLVALTVLGIL